MSTITGAQAAAILIAAKAEGKAEAVKEIVAWLRDPRNFEPRSGLADAIERGAHLNTGKEER